MRTVCKMVIGVCTTVACSFAAGLLCQAVNSYAFGVVDGIADLVKKD